MYVHTFCICVYIYIYIYAHIQMLICMLVSERFFSHLRISPFTGTQVMEAVKGDIGKEGKGSDKVFKYYFNKCLSWTYDLFF